MATFMIKYIYKNSYYKRYSLSCMRLYYQVSVSDILSFACFFLEWLLTDSFKFVREEKCY